MAGIYIHIPFCRQACHYCNFHFRTSLHLQADMVAALQQEIVLRKGELAKQEINTIYFGGGSPSILSIKELASLLSCINQEFTIHPQAEISLEANPDDLSLDYLKALKSMGINRLSIGIQSFDDKQLKFLNRIHSSKEAKQSIANARIAGFNNINIDLIYGIPADDDKQWIHSLSETMMIAPEHISAYSLTIEEKTVFGRWLAKGQLKEAEDEFHIAQYGSLIETLKQDGYEHYELSNFSLPGLHSKHNSSYWTGEAYLGIGPGAHSYDGQNTRSFIVENNPQYIKSIQKNIIPIEKEHLSPQDKLNEYLLTGLRLSQGIAIDELKRLYQYDILLKHEKRIKQYLEEDFLQLEGKYLKLTFKGKMLSNSIISSLFE